MPDHEAEAEPNGNLRSEDDISVYRDERKTLLIAEQEAAKAFDRWILTLSGGALVVSMTFVKELILPRPLGDAGYVVLSWLLFAMALVCTLISIQQSQNAHEQYRDILDESFGSDRPEFLHHARNQQIKLLRPKVIEWLNRCSLILFFLGILSLSWFAYGNIDKLEIHNGKDHTSDRQGN